MKKLYLVSLLLAFISFVGYGKTNQTISFSNIPTKTYGDANFTPSVTASSGLPVTLTSSNTSVAIIVGSQIQIVGAGTSTITASQGGNATYNAAANVSKTLTVNKKTLTVRPDDCSREYGEANPSFTITYSGFVNSEDISVIDTKPTASTSATKTSVVGAYNITASGGSDNNYTFSYASSSTTGKLTITKALATCTADNKTRVYGSSNPTFTITYTGLKNGETKTSPNLTITTTATSTSPVGTYPIKLSGSATNYDVTLVDGTLTVTQAPLTVNAGIKSKTYGNANPALTFSYSGWKNSENASVLTSVPVISTTATTFSDAGIYPITLSGGAATNYYFIYNNSTLTINKKSLTITADNKSRVYGEPNPVFTLTYSGFVLGQDKSVLLQIPTASSTATLTSPPGSYPINLLGGDALNYSLTLRSGSLTITGAPQTINIPNDTIYVGSDATDFSPATATSGLPVSYASVNTSVLSVVGGGTLLHVVGVGQTKIIASQGGSSSFDKATNVEFLVIVGKSSQTITFNNITKNYNDPEFAPGAVASSGLPVTYSTGNPAIAIPTFDGIKIVGAGVTTITATQAGNSFYVPASKTVTLTVNKIGQTITFPSLYPVDFGFADFNPGATSDSHLPVVYSSDNPSVATIVSNLVHIVGAGTANIKASQPGNANYIAAVDVSQALTVNKSSQTISFSPIQSKTYGSPDFLLDAGASSGLPITFTSSNTSVATVSGNTIHITGVGTTIIKANQAGNANYIAAPEASQSFSVSKASQSISFASLPEKAMDSPDFSLTAASSSGLPVTYVSSNPAVATVTGGVVHIVGTGSANITASQGGNSYYLAAADVVQILTVKNSSQTISFSTLPGRTYGDANFTISATASSGLPVSFVSDNTNVATVTGNIVKIVGGGIANIYAMQNGDSNYAAATPVPQQLVVNKASQSITFPALSNKIYTDDPFSAGATATSGLTVEYTSSNPLVAEVIDDLIYITGVGTTNITASQDGNSNYLPATSFVRTLNVIKGSQTITFNPIPSKAYGDPDFLLNATTTSGLPLFFESSNTNVATVLNNKVHIVGAGSCIITASQPGDENYNLAASKSQVLIVDKISQTISFDELAPVKYGSAEILLDATSTSGLPVSFSSSNSSIVNVSNGFAYILNTGSVYITAFQSGNSNYNSAVPVSRLLVVSKQDQIILFDSIPAKTYGDTDFDLTGFASSGLPITYMISNSNVAIMKNGKVHIVGAGSTVITAKQNGNSTYNATYEGVSRTLVVNKATLTVTPVKSTRKYMEPDPAFTATYFGFVPGENASVINIPPTIKSNTDINSLPGTYELIASGGSDNNYTFSYNKGVFIVLGTTPLKPATPTGNTKLCINPGTQEYKTSGAFFGATYIWSMSPENAGKATASGKTLTIAFNENFTGIVSIAVKSQNNQGISELSDTLHVNVLQKPEKVDISLHGVYCSTNSWGDTIKILKSQKDYVYQLNINEAPFGETITGDGEMIYWGDLREGSYTIREKVCNVPIADDLKIVKADPSSSKPQLEQKWNDVVICRDKGDSIDNYQWYRNGLLLPGETKQYIWTQKQEGYYSVSTTDITGCVFSSDSIWIEKQATGQIYPNPNNGNFKLTFSGSIMGNVVVRVSGINSIPVKVLNFSKEQELFETDISIPELKTGIYYIEVSVNGERVFYSKFIRE